MFKKVFETFLPKLGVLWIPSTKNVLPLLGGDNQGGYGVVRKM
jgi:hypothetical protein